MYTHSFSTLPVALLIAVCLCATACGDEEADLADLRAPAAWSLDGTWELADGSLTDTPPTTFDRKVPVPGLVTLATPAFEHVGEAWPAAASGEKLRAFWYRTTFDVAETDYHRSSLRVGRVKYGVKAWLNGQAIGSGPGAFTAHQWAAGDALKKGANELLIRVGGDPRAVATSQPTHQDLEKDRWIPGIYGTVSLRQHHSPQINVFKVVALPETGEVRVQVELYNQHADGREVRVEVRAWPVAESGAQSAPKANASASLSAGAVKSLPLEFTMPAAMPWTPEAPNLYALQVDVLRAKDGAMLDRRSGRFGFRTVRWKSSEDRAKRGFYLNGARLPLLGTNVTLHRYFEDQSAGEFLWDRQWVIDFFKLGKSLGWNTYRICVGRAPELWYDVADEVGVLLADEFMMWTVLSNQHQKWSEEAMTAEFTAWLREAWNHPSIAWWDASNETLSPLPGKVINNVRSLDPTRQWENGGFNPPQGPDDPIEDHPYKFMHIMANSLANLEDNDGKAPQGKIPVLNFATHKAPTHPYILNEYGWLWVNRDGTWTTMSKPVFEALLGTGPHAPAVLWEAHAYLVGGMTRMWRAKRGYDAIKHFVFLGYSRADGETSDNFLDVKNLKLEPRWQKQMKWGFAQVIPFIDRWQLAPAKDGTLKVPLLAINDRAVKTQALLAVMAVAAGGQIAASEALQLDLEPGGQWQGALDLAGVATPVTIYAAMAWQGADGEQVSADVRKVGLAHVGIAAPDLPKREDWPAAGSTAP